MVYAVYILLTFLAAPFWVILRSYYGRNFGLLLLCAWLLHAVVSPSAYQAAAMALEFVGDDATARTVRAFGRDSIAAVWRGFGVDPRLFSNPFMAWVFLIGAMLWPFHLVTGFVMAQQQQPPGTIGRTTIGQQVGLGNESFLFAGAIAFGLYAFGSQEYEWGLLMVPVLISFPAYVILATAGGKHGRIMALDRPIHRVVGNQRPKLDDPSAVASSVRVVQIGHDFTRSNTKGSVLDQREDGLATLATPAD